MFLRGWLFKIKFIWLEEEQGSLQHYDVTYINIHIFVIIMFECFIASLSYTKTYARVFTK